MLWVTSALAPAAIVIAELDIPTTCPPESRIRDSTVALLLAVDSLITFVLMLTIAELVLAAG